MKGSLLYLFGTILAFANGFSPSSAMQQQLQQPIEVTQDPKWQVKTYREHRGAVNISKLNRTLLPLSFEPLPLGSIRSQGWLLQQLNLMVEGLPGHMHEFYDLVQHATWLGGTSEYSPLNEAWPYYINGLVSLAAIVEDEAIIAEIRRQVTHVLDNQHPDGWLGPESELRKRNFWGRYPFFLAAIGLLEVSDTADTWKILRSLHSFVDLMHAMLKDNYQGYVRHEGDAFDEQWGRSRAADMIISLQWLYEHRPEHNAEKLLECMVMIYEQAYDWSYWFDDKIFLKDDIDKYEGPVTDALFPYLHVVNAAQGLKSPAVMARLTHDLALQDSSRQGVDLTLKHHGTPAGAIYGDERLSGQNPNRGTELCSVVEEMFSLSYLYNSLGDRSFADRLELVAFNALPGMVMPYWWAHQYVAQTNQPYAYEIEDPPFWNVRSHGTTFGLEPNYPCCTVNFPQGLPKLLAASWVKSTAGNAIVHAVLVPSEVKTALISTSKGYADNTARNQISMKCTTNYPFSDWFTYETQAEEDFDFSFRVPEWADTSHPRTGIYSATKSDLNVRDDTIKPDAGLNPDPHTGLHTLRLPAGHHKIHVILRPSTARNQSGIRLEPRPNNTIAIHHGPLLYAHALPITYHSHRPARYPGDTAPAAARDWTLTPRISPDSPHDGPDTYHSIPWNIAIDPDSLRFHAYDNRYDDVNDGFPNPVWHENAPPISILGMACEVGWKMSSKPELDYDGHSRSKGGYPLEPPSVGNRTCIGRAFPVELRPVGSARLRMIELPTVDLSPGSADLWDEQEGDHLRPGNGRAEL